MGTVPLRIVIHFWLWGAALLVAGPAMGQTGNPTPVAQNSPPPATVSDEAMARQKVLERMARLESSIPANRGVAKALFITSPILFTLGAGMIIVLNVYDRGPFTLLATVGRGIWGFFGVALMTGAIVVLIVATALLRRAGRYQNELDRLSAPPPATGDQEPRAANPPPLQPIPTLRFSF